MFFVPTHFHRELACGIGEHVLLRQKSLKMPGGAHFEPMVQRPANTAPWQGSISGRRNPAIR
ncbi:MAG: hypothetical protein AMJ54_15685 [Deltaproteobacteria bacterium SG8_13]|nr:MAG: hypothetical protein AMJ54_15685 [Deltaproteobacteria bacterium SG8_13]